MHCAFNIVLGGGGRQKKNSKPENVKLSFWGVDGFRGLNRSQMYFSYLRLPALISVRDASTGHTGATVLGQNGDEVKFLGLQTHSCIW